MRRTVAILATALLAGAAALTAPAANAAGSGPQVTPPAPVADAVAAENCSLSGRITAVVGTCTGLDPRQTWGISGYCQEIVDGFPVIEPLWTAGPGTGDGTIYATCIYGGWVASARIVFGPKPLAG